MMELSSKESKKLQIASWIKMFKRSQCSVMISDYSYNCFFNGNRITKTLVVFPDEIETKGIIAIDKPLDEVEVTDIIKIYKRIK